MKVTVLVVLITATLWGFPSCSGEPPAGRVLFDFESDADLDRLNWKCHALFSLSDKNATHGSKSLQIELYPSEYPGMEPKLSVNDWRGYEVLSFDVYNPESEEIPMAVRIDDREDYPDYDERYNERFILKPGLNRLSIRLSSLVTSGTQRTLDLKKIYRFILFMVRPRRKFVLYVDYIRLH